MYREGRIRYGVESAEMRLAESLASWHVQTGREKGDKERKLTFIKYLTLI